MTSKANNPTIGMIPCPVVGCGELNAIRKNVRGRFYLICPHHGRQPCDGPAFQDWILEHPDAVWWYDSVPPEEAPAWIANNVSRPSKYAHVPRPTRGRPPAAPAPDPEPDPEPPPAAPAQPAPAPEPEPEESEGSFLPWEV